MNKIEDIEQLLAKWKAIDADDKMNGYSGWRMEWNEKKFLKQGSTLNNMA